MPAIVLKLYALVDFFLSETLCNKKFKFENNCNMCVKNFNTE